MTQLTATFTVTIKTKPDGDYYFDHDDLVRNAVPWIEGGLDDRDDIAEVTITEQPAAVSAAVAPPTQAALREVVADTLAKVDGWVFAPGFKEGSPTYQGFLRQADAVLAELPEPTDRAASDLEIARTTNQRLNREKQRLESELAAYRRAVSQWEISERGTYIPHASLRAIGLASGKDILGSVRHLKHFERVEQAEAEVERLRAGRAAALREAALHLYTALFPAVYDDMGQKAAEGVNRAVSELRRMADETATTDVEASLADGPVRCPLCPTPLTLHTPSGARAHFTTVHPEQRITGRSSGPWPLLVTDETATETLAEAPARIDRLRPEFFEHASVESIDAQIRRAQRQQRHWGNRERTLAILRQTRVMQKEHGEWPAAGARQDGATQ